MQLLNSNIPRSARTTRYGNKKAQDLLTLVLFMFCSFFVLQRWLPLSDNSNIPIPLFKHIHAYKVFTLY